MKKVMIGLLIISSVAVAGVYAEKDKELTSTVFRGTGDGGGHNR